MPCAVDTVITIELCWLAIGAVVWALIVRASGEKWRLSRASIVVASVGTIVAWPVAIWGALALWSARR